MTVEIIYWDSDAFLGHLQAEAGIDVDQNAVSTLARRLTSGVEPPFDQAEALFHHVDQDIANEQSTCLRGPTFFEPQHQQTVALFALKGIARRFRDLNGLCAHTQIAALYAPMCCQSLFNSP